MCAFSAYRVRTQREFCAKKPTVYLGADAVSKFIDYLQEEFKTICECIEKNHYPIDMTSTSEALFAAADHCQICHVKFHHPEEKYRDHDHLKKKDNYRAALCNSCNFIYAKLPAKPCIKILFHNSCRYDMHFLIQELSRRKTDMKHIQTIPKNTERFLTLKFFSYFQVLDTYEFLPSPPASLVKNLKEQGLDKFLHLKTITKDCAQCMEMLCSKQYYPYEYAQTLNDYYLLGLPAREEFVDKLAGKGPISEAEYASVKDVFAATGCTTFGDYTKLYVQTDVLLLADVMEAHRHRTWKKFGLDPIHFLTASHLGWNAFLKSKEPSIPLENLTDKKMYDFFQKAVRGGIAVVSKRYAKANHLLMKTGYDPTKPHNFILALDCVGLYSWTMCQPLPHSNFEWVDGLSQNEMKEMLINTPADGAVGYFACVDLQYPAHIHDETRCYPLAPEKISIEESMLSEYSKDMKKKLKLPKQNKRLMKLAPNQRDKVRYTVHFACLQFYLEKGMVLGKIHQMVRFKQYPWMKAYIEGNLQRRKEAQNTFDKDFWKLMNNSLYGKSIENVYKRQNLTLCTRTEQLDKLVRNPTFEAVHVFNDNLVAALHRKQMVTLDKAPYAGATILELSKKHMFGFFYELKNTLFKRGEMQLLLTDTDSLIMEIATKDVYKDLAKITHLLDTSNYPPAHPLYSIRHKMEAGMFKDEHPPDNFITEFVGLKAKCYSLLFANEETKLRCKGLNKSGMNAVRHAAYLECLREGAAKDTDVRAIRSFGHRLFSVACTKRCLTAFDDKRHILPGGIETLPHFHHDTASDWSLKMDLTKGKFINVSRWNGNPYYHLVNRNTQTRITLNEEDLNLIIQKSSILKEKALRLDGKKTPGYKRKMDKRSRDPEKHTGEDKKKRKSSHEREDHSRNEDNYTFSESESDY